MESEDVEMTTSDDDTARDHDVGMSDIEFSTYIAPEPWDVSQNTIDPFKYWGAKGSDRQADHVVTKGWPALQDDTTSSSLTISGYDEVEDILSDHNADDQWPEPKVEQLITYMGNVQDYHLEGTGQEWRDRDLAAMLEKHDVSETYTSSERLVDVCDTSKFFAKPTGMLPSHVHSPAQRQMMFTSLQKGNSSPYQNLPSGRHIRLLEVLPGRGSAIHCVFHVVTLEEAADCYEALSYSWEMNSHYGALPYSWEFDLRGNPSTGAAQQYEVTCNGIVVSVKQNLYDALLMLRQPDTSRIIWADALCIDQTNLQERGSQVALMSLIFQSAFRVVIWLGATNAEQMTTAADHIAGGQAYKAFQGICVLVNGWLRRKGVTASASFATLPTQIVSTQSSLPLSTKSESWLDIFDLFSHRWFTRLWVVQEALLARSAMVVWGRCMISWDLIGIAASIIRTNYNRIHPSLRTDSDKATRRTIPTGVVNAYFMYRNSASQGYSDRLQYSFHTLLSLTRQFECLDPRDRLYGLLGLPTTDRMNESIVPDYTKSATELYIEVTRQMIYQSRSLNILSSIQRDHRKDVFSYYEEDSNFDHNAPSWVPQWNVVRSRSLAPLTVEASFNASHRLPARLQDQQDGLSLVVQGIIVGGATSISGFYYNSFWRGEQESSGWRYFDPNPGDQKRPATKDARLISILEKNHWTMAELKVLASTLTGGKNWYGLPIADIDAHVADLARCHLRDGLVWSLEKPNPLHEMHETQGNLHKAPLPQVSKAMPDQHNTHHTYTRTATTTTDPTPIITLPLLQHLAETHHGKADRFLDAARTTCANRCRFTVHDGQASMMGIGPDAMEEGDLLCVFYGADMPFVIRPTTGDGFSLIGECYVEGLMRGEAVREVARPGTTYAERWITLI